jgi:hypothetical protein
MSHRRAITRGLVALACVLASVLVLGSASAGADPDSQTAVNAAVDWLKTQQHPDGGFDVAGSLGFATPDAVLVLAEAGQTGSTWSTSEGLAAVQAVKVNGHTGLHVLDDLADSHPDPGKAAQLIVLDVVPLGLDPAHFDPDGDGSSDLVAILDAGAAADGSYGTFNHTLYAALAKWLVAGSVPASTVAFIRSHQQANGGWGFAGDPAGTDVDPDTTGLAMQALVASGADPASDASLSRAVAFLADQHGADGSWKSPFDNGNPNSTALAALAVGAAGYDPAAPCWRDTFAPAKAGTPYTDPSAYLRAQQAADGHVASPSDSFGLNTFGTTQAVEALLASWLPVARAPAVTCTEPPPSTTSTTATPAVTVLGTEVENGATPAGQLPATGPAGEAGLVFGALGAVAIGMVLVGVSRRHA